MIQHRNSNSADAIAPWTELAIDRLYLPVSEHREFANSALSDVIDSLDSVRSKGVVDDRSKLYARLVILAAKRAKIPLKIC